MASTTRPAPLPLTSGDGEASPDNRDKWQIQQHQIDNIEPYSPYTMAHTGVSGAFALGTGAYSLARFKRQGPEVSIEFIKYFGNPGYNSGGGSPWSFSLPIPIVLAQLPLIWPEKMIGTCKFNSGVGGLEYIGACVTYAANLKTFKVTLHGFAPGAVLTGLNPAQFQGAILEGNIHYECKY